MELAKLGITGKSPFRVLFSSIWAWREKRL